MNILIVGGLLGLAVLAILGAVLLGVGEDRSEKAEKALAEQQASATALLPQQSQSRQAVSQGPAFSQGPAVSQGPAFSQGPAYPSVPATPLLGRPTVTLPFSSTGGTMDSLSLADLNGQVREITSELRVLAQHTGELQQRLATLGETLEKHEQPSEEFPHSNSSNDLFASDTEETQVF